MAGDAASAGLIAGLVSATLCWFGIVRRRRAMGKSATVAHVVGLASSPFVLLAVFGLFDDPSPFALFFAALVFVPLALFVRPRRAIANPEPQPVVARPPPAPPVIDLLALEATRRQSLAALRRATKAREADKRRDLADVKRRQSIDDPLANWKRTAPAEPKKRTRAAPVLKSKGRRLDVVRFGYVNGEGDYSSRRVVVKVITDRYFKGTDTDLMETRTFRHDRVVGLITSEETGEVAPAEEWASKFG